MSFSSNADLRPTQSPVPSSPFMTFDFNMYSVSVVLVCLSIEKSMPDVAAMGCTPYCPPVDTNFFSFVS